MSASSDAAGELEPAFTDNDGRFEFVGIAAGRYSLSATKAGYTATRFGAHNLFDRAGTVDVGSSSVVDRIEIRMTRGAAISGRIVDDLGDPIVGASVTAGRIVRTGGRAALAAAGSAGVTDDLGEYRISGLSAGAYVVSVSSAAGSTAMEMLPTPGFFVNIVNNPAMVRSGWARSYYPGTNTLAQAQSIGVRDGDEITGIDFAVRPTPETTLSMTIVDSAGNPASGFYALAPDGFVERFVNSGSFQGGSASTRVEPGEWVLRVRSGDEMATARVSTGGENVAVNLTLTKGGRVGGTAVFEGSAPAPNEIVFLEAAERGETGVFGAFNGTPGRINRDGTFALTGLLGIRDFRVRSSPPGDWTLKSLTLNGRSLLDGPAEFSGRENLTGVQAILTKRLCELTGWVVATIDGEARMLTDYSVVVFPADSARLRNPARWTRWIKPDQNGGFTINDLPAGDYLAIAVGEVDASEWSNPEYLERFRTNAAPVTLRDGEKREVTLSFAGR